MSKPFKTIDEQIALLRYRGMTIADDEVARHALETLGYYQLSGDWYSFREHAPEEALGCRSDLFIPGTSFDQVIRLYDFDTQLRVTVFKELTKIEVSLRAIIGYEIGEVDPLLHLTAPSTKEPGIQRSRKKKDYTKTGNAATRIPSKTPQRHLFSTT